MELDSIRKELNMYDNIIKNMVTLRMALIPIVADIKMRNNLPLFQAKREEEIYKNIEKFSKEHGVDAKLVTEIYKLIIANALKIEEEVVEKPETAIINKNIKKEEIKSIEENFEKLDHILTKDIPEIISNIVKSESLSGLSLIEKATLYYNNKTNNQK